METVLFKSFLLELIESYCDLENQVRIIIGLEVRIQTPNRPAWAHLLAGLHPLEFSLNCVT